jgi:hypothetical protein
VLNGERATVDYPKSRGESREDLSILTICRSNGEDRLCWDLGSHHPRGAQVVRHQENPTLHISAVRFTAVALSCF